MGQTPRPADTGISIGQVFLGKYRVEQILGQGGMGVVARCTHLALNEQVAVKMLRQDVLQDDESRERFMREAQAAVKLRSEYVARVSDVGTFENGVPYMVMEYLDGHDLGALIDEQGHVAVPWAVELMLQAAEALAEAHSINIVHRDVKPTNLFVTWRPDGTSLVKVLDFGISKSPMGTDMQLTQTQSLLGTPAYMSPEQMRSARLVDSRSDIWSLGSVMYELLEGHRPFEADSFSEMCVKVAVDAPAPMQHTPPELQQVVLRCLAKSPEQRYSSMSELGRDLIPFARDQHQAAMLVERMHRMLGRTTGGWEGGQTNPASRATPVPVRDAKSAPIRAQSPVAWHGGSEPSGSRFTPVPYPITSREPSAPAASPSEAIPAVRRSMWPLALAAAFLIGGGIAAAYAMFGRDDAATQVAPAAAPDASTQPQPAIDPGASAKTVDAAASDPASAGSGSAAATPDTTVKTVKTDEPIEVDPPDDPDPVKPHKKPPKKQPKVTKVPSKVPPKEDVKPPEPPKETKPAFDPFGSPRPDKR
ncbi:MAG: protein kinase [Deltaproteobacteria bacterium]|nr:protein kinase [Deltaproteobacteria bacterium]MDQ3296192.1 protein kinase [Myxococcota bacterium]